MRVLRILIVLLLGIGLLAVTLGRISDGPRFTVIDEFDASVEVRDYAPMQIAWLRVDETDFRLAATSGSKQLSAYILGTNDPRKRSGRSSPVLQRKRDKAWEIGMVIPDRYAAGRLPRPSNAAIQVDDLPQRPVAAIRFGGRWNPVRHAEHLRLLKREVERAGWVPEGEPIVAQFGPLWLPGPLRRNEVLLPVRRRG